MKTKDCGGGEGGVDEQCTGDGVDKAEKLRSTKEKKREEKRVFREDEEYLCGEVKRATRWAKER